jgi:hypothetical protein
MPGANRASTESRRRASSRIVSGVKRSRCVKCTILDTFVFGTALPIVRKNGQIDAVITMHSLHRETAEQCLPLDVVDAKVGNDGVLRFRFDRRIPAVFS